MSDDRPTIAETQALVLKLAAVTRERDQLRSIVAELTAFIGEHTMRTSHFGQKMQREIDESIPPAPPDDEAGIVIAESYSHGQQIIERMQRVREKAQ